MTSRDAIPGRAGVGLRAQHHLHVLNETPRVGWLEVHSENFFADGGSHIDALFKIRGHYPLSLHGVGLSLGSADSLSNEHLALLRRAIARFEPDLVSEHLSWSSFGGWVANDLLPLPFTEEALRHVSRKIAAAQDALSRQILVENISSYFQFAHAAMTEWEFVAGVAMESGCGILLDINNIHVAAENHGFDAQRYLQAIPVGSVQELHLAGHTAVDIKGRSILIDTHGGPVSEPVWDLYAAAVARFGPVPALIEWDTDIPPFSVLQQEADKADAVREGSHAVAA